MYPNLEVIVVDDKSTDTTPDILDGLSGEFPSLRILKGAPTPEGWLGKSWALEQGRKVATGEWLLFVDSDIRFSPSFLRRSVGYAEEPKASMLFLLPNMETGSVGGALSPMWLANRSRSKLITAGGGVFNLVKRGALEAADAFESLKDAVVDDVALGYRVKAAGHGQALGLAENLIGVRIYHGLGETIRGFRKNLYPSLRRVPWVIPLIVALGAFLKFLPLTGLVLCAGGADLWIPTLAALGLSLSVPAGIAFFYHQSWVIVPLGPVRELLFWWILFLSMSDYFRKGICWRGRTHDS